jgi:hypothetical protein
LIEKPLKGLTIRQQITAFAEAEGLPL